MENMPQVGQGATKIYPQDRYGMVVTKVSKSGRVIHLASLETPGVSTGHEPEGLCNGFPVWNHQYTEDELVSMKIGNEQKAFWSDKRKCYMMGGHTPVSVGQARYYRNFAD